MAIVGAYPNRVILMLKFRREVDVACFNAGVGGPRQPLDVACRRVRQVASTYARRRPRYAALARLVGTIACVTLCQEAHAARQERRFLDAALKSRALDLLGRLELRLRRSMLLEADGNLLGALAELKRARRMAETQWPDRLASIDGELRRLGRAVSRAPRRPAKRVGRR